MHIHTHDNIVLYVNIRIDSFSLSDKVFSFIIEPFTKTVFYFLQSMFSTDDVISVVQCCAHNNYVCRD